MELSRSQVATVARLTDMGYSPSAVQGRPDGAVSALVYRKMRGGFIVLRIDRDGSWTDDDANITERAIVTRHRRMQQRASAQTH